jgi:hypothetical protein
MGLAAPSSNQACSAASTPKNQLPIPFNVTSIENTPHMYRKDLVFIGVDKHESKNNKEQEIKSILLPPIHASILRASVRRIQYLIWLTKW